jgi:hypothetical protein
MARAFFSVHDAQERTRTSTPWRELAPEARSARRERLRNSWLRRAVPNVGPIYGPVGGQFLVNGAAGGGRRSGIASEKRISQHLSGPQ